MGFCCELRVINQEQKLERRQDMKNQKRTCARKFRGLLALVLIAVAVQAASAQSPAGVTGDEQRLRELVRLENEGKDVIKYTDEAILSSGAAPLPVIGAEARKKHSEELNSKRFNQKRTVETRRLVVAKSGDMAYEFGNFTLSFDTPEKKNVALNGSYLRVWRKFGGEWMVDALSARPNGPVTEKPLNQSR
jgi:ketosteroid isomerase-like protein